MHYSNFKKLIWSSIGEEGSRKLEEVNAGVKRKTAKSGHEQSRSRAVCGDLVEGPTRKLPVQRECVD